MAVRFNVNPKTAAEHYALNRAEQRRAAGGAQTIPVASQAPTRAAIADAIDHGSVGKSLAGQRRGGPSDASIASAFWREPSAASSLLPQWLAAGPVHMTSVLAECEAVAVKDHKGADAKTVRLNVRLRLESALRDAVGSSDQGIRMNAARSLLHIAERAIANPESLHVHLSQAILYVQNMRRVLVPQASDARLRGSIRKRALLLDALEKDGLKAFRAKAEVLIAQTEPVVKDPNPDSKPSPGFYLINQSHRYLATEQRERFDALLVLDYVKKYPSEDAFFQREVLERAGQAKFKEAAEMFQHFAKSEPKLIDDAGRFLSDEQKEEARRSFATHDARIDDTLRSMRQLYMLAVVPPAGHA